MIYKVDQNRSVRFTVHLPFPHPQPRRGHSHWGPHRKWLQWLPQNNGSTSFSLSADLQHQTSCVHMRKQIQLLHKHSLSCSYYSCDVFLCVFYKDVHQHTHTDGARWCLHSHISCLCLALHLSPWEASLIYTTIFSWSRNEIREHRVFQHQSSDYTFLDPEHFYGITNEGRPGRLLH